MSAAALVGGCSRLYCAHATCFRHPRHTHAGARLRLHVRCARRPLRRGGGLRCARAVRRAAGHRLRGGARGARGRARRTRPRQAQARAAHAGGPVLRRRGRRVRAAPERSVHRAAVRVRPPVHAAGRRAAHGSLAARLAHRGAVGGHGGRPVGALRSRGGGLHAAQRRRQAGGRAARAPERRAAHGGALARVRVRLVGGEQPGGERRRGGVLAPSAARCGRACPGRRLHAQQKASSHRQPGGRRRGHLRRAGCARQPGRRARRRHRFGQDGGLPPGHRAHARRRSERHRARARDLAHAPDGGALPRPLRGHRGGHALAHEPGRALRPMGRHPRRRRARGGGRPQRAVHAAVQRGPHRGGRGPRRLVQAGPGAALRRVRSGRVDDAPPGRHARARLGDAARGALVQLRQAAQLAPRAPARARQRQAAARGRGGGHGARVRQRASLHVLTPAAEGAFRRARRGPESGAFAQPARVREVLAVPRLRFRARVPALRHVAHGPRAGQRARVPPLRPPRPGAARLPEVRQPVPEEVRRGHAARRGGAARPARGALRRRGRAAGAGGRGRT